MGLDLVLKYLLIHKGGAKPKPKINFAYFDRALLVGWLMLKRQASVIRRCRDIFPAREIRIGQL